MSETLQNSLSGILGRTYPAKEKFLPSAINNHNHSQALSSKTTTSFVPFLNERDRLGNLIVDSHSHGLTSTVSTGALPHRPTKIEYALQFKPNQSKSHIREILTYDNTKKSQPENNQSVYSTEIQTLPPNYNGYHKVSASDLPNPSDPDTGTLKNFRTAENVFQKNHRVMKQTFRMQSSKQLLAGF
jgi:hypothetical protein